MDQQIPKNVVQAANGLDPNRKELTLESMFTDSDTSLHQMNSSQNTLVHSGNTSKIFAKLSNPLSKSESSVRGSSGIKSLGPTPTASDYLVDPITKDSTALNSVSPNNLKTPVKSEAAHPPLAALMTTQPIRGPLAVSPMSPQAVTSNDSEGSVIVQNTLPTSKSGSAYSSVVNTPSASSATSGTFRNFSQHFRRPSSVLGGIFGRRSSSSNEVSHLSAQQQSPTKSASPGSPAFSPQTPPSIITDLRQMNSSHNSLNLIATANHPPSPLSSSYSSLVSPRTQVKETKLIEKIVDPDTGQKMINQYLVIKLLGRGVHGKVKLCMDTETNEYRAIKIVPKQSKRRFGLRSDDEMQKIQKEIAILKKVSHTNIVRLFEVMDDPTHHKIYLVMEYVDGGDLKWKDDLDDPILSLEECKGYFRDMVVGLEYLHYQGIIHRDIKPQNILVTQNKVAKIADFGVSVLSERLANGQLHSSQSVEDEDLAKTAGSPAFFAPELCSDTTNISMAVKMRTQRSRAITEDSNRCFFVHDSDDFPTSPTSLISSDRTSDIINLSRNQSSEQSELMQQSNPKGFGSPGLPAVSEKNSSEFDDSLEELKNEKPSSRPKIGRPIDFWALGVTLYCLIYGRLPFEATNEFELFSIIPVAPIPYPDNTCRGDLKKTDPFLIDLLDSLLEKDPAKRMNLCAAKRHAWIRNVIPGATEDEQEKWLNDSDPAVYCPLMAQLDDSAYDLQGVIKVTEEDMKGAVTVGILGRWMSRLKRRFSRSISSLIGGSSQNNSSAALPQIADEDRCSSPLKPRPSTARRSYTALASFGTTDETRKPASRPQTATDTGRNKKLSGPQSSQTAFEMEFQDLNLDKSHSEQAAGLADIRRAAAEQAIRKTREREHQK